MVTINVYVTEGMVRLWERKYFLLWIVGFSIYQQAALGLINSLFIIGLFLFTRFNLITVVMISIVFVLVAGIFFKV